MKKSTHQNLITLAKLGEYDTVKKFIEKGTLLFGWTAQDVSDVWNGLKEVNPDFSLQVVKDNHVNLLWICIAFHLKGNNFYFYDKLTKQEKEKFKEFYIYDYCGYKKNTQNPHHGVVLENGDVIEVDYMGHNFLFEELKKVGWSDSRDWVCSKKILKFTHKQVNGNVAMEVRYFSDYGDVNDIQLLKNEGQLKSTFNLGLDMYGDRNCFNWYVYNAFVASCDNGGKYGGLRFLEYFFPEINIPKYSNEYFYGCGILRTSPFKSMPGVLDSLLVDGNNWQSKIVEIQNKFDSVKEKFPNNKLGYFFQELVDGKNGVCGITGNVFSAQYASRGQIVGGAKGEQLPSTIHNKIEQLVTDIHNKMKCDIQLEFVVDKDNKVWIVQFRVFKNKDLYYNLDKLNYKPFCGEMKGKVTVGVDCLYIPSGEAEKINPIEALDKSLVIVTDDIEFCHLLCFCKVNNIPAIYAYNEPLQNGDVVYFDYSNFNKIKKINNEIV